MPETYQDIVDLLIPELQRRGAYKKEYRPGTLREKLFRQGPYLPETHPGKMGEFRSCRILNSEFRSQKSEVEGDGCWE
jgi:hypothetical protein